MNGRIEVRYESSTECREEQVRGVVEKNKAEEEE